MTSYQIQQLTDAQDLPEAWDALAYSYFQRKPFLLHAQAYNPCNQRYYLLYRGSELCGGGIVYTLRIHLLTYLRINSPLSMHIVGVPCSVSSAGLLGKADAMQQLKREIHKREQGFVLMLNLPEPETGNAFAQGQTLPALIFHNHFPSWEAYLAALRAPYRRRLRLLENTPAKATLHPVPVSAFTDKMHAQYLQVYERSKDKLEKLSLDFFRNLPEDFQLWVCQDDQRILGWYISLQDGASLYFFLGGVDHAHPEQDFIYLKLLAGLVRQGIAQGVSIIDFGQTAEEAKMRMGAIPRACYMLGAHSHPFMHGILRMVQGQLSYRKKLKAHRVFRQ